MKKLTIHKLVRNKQQGFTLVEMLVVAALIAIFAAIAVFNITEQLQREKVKAATAEARGIATSMSFAYNDMGFFPKLCFLRFGLEELEDYISKNPLSTSAMEYHSYPVEGVMNKLKLNWRQKYLAGTLPEKLVNMQLPAPDSGITLDWPKDPFGSPYVAYLIKVDPSKPLSVSFVESAGEKPNYFAGIVSYGRNRVPGGKDVNPEFADIEARYPYRLYRALDEGQRGNPQNRDFVLMSGDQLRNSAAALEQIVRNTDEDIPADPGIRDNGSDDRYYEF